MTVYPLERLYEEMAYIAFHFHWPQHEVMQMDHLQRREWVDQIASINSRLNELERSKE